MNKRDIISMCYDRIKQLESITNAIESHYATATAYYDCKAAAAAAGYVGACFDDLWHRAIDERVRELNIKEDRIV